ncbi:hypothetical protein J1614_010741 [Plenodomus biglobosus]|nr:hypothetical protein J1614_010741 [Plenodomus biglobosus]
MHLSSHFRDVERHAPLRQAVVDAATSDTVSSEGLYIGPVLQLVDCISQHNEEKHVLIVLESHLLVETSPLRQLGSPQSLPAAMDPSQKIRCDCVDSTNGTEEACGDRINCAESDSPSPHVYSIEALRLLLMHAQFLRKDQWKERLP